MSLRVTKGSYEIEVRFDHEFYEPGEIEGLTGICVNEKRRCSVATVIVNGSIVSCGMAVCHPKDNFCRAIGRKKALFYALSSFDKIIRTAIWDKYKIQCGL